MNSRKLKGGRHKGQMESSMVSFKVTKKMRKKAPPDNYELTEEERKAIIARNMASSKVSDKVRQRYEKSIGKAPEK